VKTSRSSDYKFKKGAASESHERDIYIHKENQLSDKKIVAVGTIKAGEKTVTASPEIKKK
jgi:hypothetical protein